MSKLIYKGGVDASCGDDIEVATDIRWFCQECPRVKPHKIPRLLFVGLVTGTLEIKCPQCHQFNRFSFKEHQ